MRRKKRARFRAEETRTERELTRHAQATGCAQAAVEEEDTDSHPPLRLLPVLSNRRSVPTVVVEGLGDVNENKDGGWDRFVIAARSSAEGVDGVEEANGGPLRSKFVDEDYSWEHSDSEASEDSADAMDMNEGSDGHGDPSELGGCSDVAMDAQYARSVATVMPFKSLDVTRSVVPRRGARPPCVVAPMSRVRYRSGQGVTALAKMERNIVSGGHDVGGASPEYSVQLANEIKSGNGSALEQFATAVRRVVKTTPAPARTNAPPQKDEVLRSPWDLESEDTYTWYRGYDVVHGISYVHPLVLRSFRPVYPLYHGDSPRVKSLGPVSKLLRIDPSKDYLQAALQYIRAAAVQAGRLPTPMVEVQKLVARQYNRYELMLDRILEVNKAGRAGARGYHKGVTVKPLVGRQALLLTPLLFSPRHILVGQDPDTFCAKERARTVPKRTEEQHTILESTFAGLIGPQLSAASSVSDVQSDLDGRSHINDPSHLSNQIDLSSVFVPVVTLYDKGLQPPLLFKGVRPLRTTDLPPPFPTTQPQPYVPPHLRQITYKTSWEELMRRREEHRAQKKIEYRNTKKLKDALEWCREAAMLPTRQTLAQHTLIQRCRRGVQVLRMFDNMKRTGLPEGTQLTHYTGPIGGERVYARVRTPEDGPAIADANERYKAEQARLAAKREKKRVCSEESKEQTARSRKRNRLAATDTDPDTDPGTDPVLLSKSPIPSKISSASPSSADVAEVDRQSGPEDQERDTREERDASTPSPTRKIEHPAIAAAVISPTLVGGLTCARHTDMVAKGIEAFKKLASSGGLPPTRPNPNPLPVRHVQHPLPSPPARSPVVGSPPMYPAAPVYRPQPVRPPPVHPQPPPLHPQLRKWIQCQTCEKWREIPYNVQEEDIPDRWSCFGNIWNPLMASCSIPQSMTNDAIDEILAEQEMRLQHPTQSPTLGPTFGPTLGAPPPRAPFPASPPWQPQPRPQWAPRPYEPESNKRESTRVWTAAMHQRFMDAVNVLGGLDMATPKKLLDIMAVPGLQARQVANYLQKQRRQGTGPRSSPPPRQPSARSAKFNMHPDYA